MKKSIFILLVLLVNLEAKTGAFIEVGFQQKSQEIFSKNQARNFAFGYLFDLTSTIGIGLQAGYSNFSKRPYQVDKQNYELHQYAFDFLMNPIVINIGKFRILTKLGQSRFYTNYISQGVERRGPYNLLTVRGVGVDFPLKDRLSLSGTFLEQFAKEMKMLKINGKRMKEPLLKRFELSLRYTFPSS